MSLFEQTNLLVNTTNNYVRKYKIVSPNNFVLCNEIGLSEREYIIYASWKIYKSKPNRLLASEIFLSNP